MWRLTFGAETAFLKASRGLSDLALLLANPNEEIHVRALMSGGAEASVENAEPLIALNRSR